MLTVCTCTCIMYMSLAIIVEWSILSSWHVVLIIISRPIVTYTYSILYTCTSLYSFKMFLYIPDFQFCSVVNLLIIIVFKIGRGVSAIQMYGHGSDLTSQFGCCSSYWSSDWRYNFDSSAWKYCGAGQLSGHKLLVMIHWKLCLINQGWLL